MRTVRLRISLREVSPAVVRVIDVPATASLPELHELLQMALGWTNSHLHQFVASDRTYGVANPDWDDGLQQDEARMRLRDLPAHFEYHYDFGDGWEHDVEVVGAGGEVPGCVEGTGGCPPEDCGGAPGYAELQAVLADPGHEDHARLREWAGELPSFDRAATDLLVRQTVGEVPVSVRLLLDLLAGGVRLTPGGRLPRSVVRQMQQHRPGWHPLDRPASIEEDLVPLAVLHDMLRRVGLLRLARGVLTPTRAAADDLQTVRRLRSWFEPEDGFRGILATAAVALLSASGPIRCAELAERVYALLGNRWSLDGRPLTGADVDSMINGMRADLEALDLVEGEGRTWRAGPSAQTLLPRATALSAIWSRDPAW
ncbi:plasmid pRiA4b ORF-3 family protein [Pseudonocardia nantongensis]|uniref:plasmid pRiA4b ORF-3 family protein n=1 Tax=Pseudonocardia nantongensis TaxID=1181885 RepID=UPI00397BDAC0